MFKTTSSDAGAGMSSARTDSQVFISGAGPVGLCLALLLARAGVDVCVCEAEPTISEDLRASTFHPPTLDPGAAHRILPAMGRRWRSAVPYDSRRVDGRI